MSGGLQPKREEMDLARQAPRIRKAFDEVLLRTLQILAPTMSAAYVVLAYFHTRMLAPEHAAIMAPVAIVTAGIFGLVGVAAHGGRVPTSQTHTATALCGTIASFNILLHMHVTQDPSQIMLLLLGIVSGGALLILRHSLGAFVIFTVTGWTVVVVLSPTGLDWQHNIFGVFCAVLISFVIHAGRVAALKKLHHMHLKELDERKNLQEILIRRAFHDDLTGLPNRRLLAERITHELRTGRGGSDAGKLAVLFIDLDEFKVVNDTLGHQAGDDLITVVASRLAASVSSAAAVARIGGDEFVVMDPSVDSATEAIEIARRIQRALRAPVITRGVEHFLTASIGIAVAEEGCEGADALLRDADTAMYRAKRSGAGRIECFRQHMHHEARRHSVVRNELPRAIERDELRLVYQPQFCLRTGQLKGVEALIRWERPGERMAIPPSEFIPLAEQSGVIVQIGEWVLDRACTEALELQRAAGRELTMAVNLSARQLTESDFVPNVERRLERAGFDPTLLELEITEGVFLDQATRVERALADLHKLGTRLAIDDFGTGYSSLSYLSRLPVSTLKIDKSFLELAGNDSHSDAMVRGIVALGHAADLKVIAEGIETADQLRLLRHAVCDEGQGFLLSRPITLESLLASPVLQHGVATEISLAGLGTPDFTSEEEQPEPISARL